MKVYVIMGNDYPDGVMTDKSTAEELCELRMDAQKRRKGIKGDPCERGPRIYWRTYEYELDGEPSAKIACRVCKTTDPTMFLRCTRADCTNGRG